MFFDLLSILFGKIFFFTGTVRDSGTFPKPLSPEDEKNIWRLRVRATKKLKQTYKAQYAPCCPRGQKVYGFGGNGRPAFRRVDRAYQGD